MRCVECDFEIDMGSGKCLKCGRVAFKVDDSSGADSGNVEPYLPGTDDNDGIEGTGRVSMIEFEPEKTKIPLMVVISNVVVVLGVIGILIFYLFVR